MDIVQLDVPLFIRLLELSREEIKQDADIHDLTQAVISLSKDGPVTMANYDQLVAFMNKQGKPADEEYAPDDIRRFRQIVDLATAQDAQYSNTPKEEYADITAVTSAAGGGINNPKHVKDIRGNSTRVYGDN